MVDLAAVDGLRAMVRGAVLCPGQDGYDTARIIPNAMIDRRPAVIARCTGTADVMACVRFARERDLVVAVIPSVARNRCGWVVHKLCSSCLPPTPVPRYARDDIVRKLIKGLTLATLNCSGSLS